MRTRSRLGISAFLLVLLSALPASVENPGPLRLEKEIPSSRLQGRLGAGDKAAVIGGQEDYSLGDLIGLTHPPERDLCRHLRSELRDLLFVAQALISLSWHHTGADGVDANFTLLQIAGPGAGKGTNRCFRGLKGKARAPEQRHGPIDQKNRNVPARGPPCSGL